MSIKISRTHGLVADVLDYRVIRQDMTSSKIANAALNELQEGSKVSIDEVATQQVKDLHQAALAINKAELSMKLMLKIRSKALNAYEELSRTKL